MSRLPLVLLVGMLIAAPEVSHGQSRAPADPAAKSMPQPKPPIPSAQEQGSEPPPAWRRAECAWTGQRIVSLLWRDDVNTAREQTRFYELFGCPAEHLPVAFRCVIEQSESQPEQNDLTARVYACWMAPEARETQE